MNSVKVYLKPRPGRENSKFQESDNKIIYLGRDRDPNITNGKEKEFSQIEYAVDKIIHPPIHPYNSMDLQHHALLFCEGTSSTIFTYGYSNSGKTFTWFDENEGVIWPLIKDILYHKGDYILKMSICELYNDKLKNLLSKSDCNLTMFSGNMMQIVEDGKGKKSSINVCINNEIEFRNKMSIALKRRQVSATQHNEQSSRSHLIINFYLEGIDSKQNTTTLSRLALMDCAGNERLGSKTVSKKQTIEAGSINGNLFELKRCIRFLSRHKEDENQSKFAFRGSKLTLTLKGSDYISIIACVDLLNENDSKNTLDFIIKGRYTTPQHHSFISRDSKESLCPILPTPATNEVNDMIKTELNSLLDGLNGPTDLGILSAIKWIKKERIIKENALKDEAEEQLNIIENINELFGDKTDSLDYLYTSVVQLKDMFGAHVEAKSLLEASQQLITNYLEMQQENTKLKQDILCLANDKKELAIKLDSQKQIQFSGQDVTNAPKFQLKGDKRKLPYMDKENEPTIVSTRSRSKRIRLQK